MTTCENLIDDIETEIKKVALISPFKQAAFGALNLDMEYPAMHFTLKVREPFDDPHIVNTTMQLRWELFYEVQVLYARLPNAQAWDEARQHVDKGVEIFIDQMPQSARLNGKAWWIEPSNVRYGLVEFESASEKEYVLGGLFDLQIKFTQDVS